MREREVFFNRAMLPPIEEYYEQLKDIWDSKWLATFGPKQVLFEEQLRKYLGIKKDVLVFANGHTALEAVVGSIGRTGEIITTPFTFISTANAIVRNEHIPVFCDVNDNMTIDVKQIEELISSRTVAILATHVMGNVCDIEDLEKIGKKYGIKVIYDGAHVFGVNYYGKSVCEYGDATMFSFHASKVFNSAEGGAAVINDDEMRFRTEKYRYFGMSDNTAILAGTNGKMHELTAALGICNLRRIDDYIQRRKELYDLYKLKLKDTRGISFRSEDEHIKYNYIYCYLSVNKIEFGLNADELLKELNSRGVHAKKCFPSLICDMEIYKNSKRGIISKAYLFLENTIVLPLHADLTIQDVEYVCDVIKGAKK